MTFFKPDKEIMIIPEAVNYDRHNIGFGAFAIDLAHQALEKRQQTIIDLKNYNIRHCSAGFLQAFILAEKLGGGFLKVINYPLNDVSLNSLQRISQEYLENLFKNSISPTTIKK